jgi:hypothetical protein
MRTKGTDNKRNKYKLFIYDTINNIWIGKDEYPSYKHIASKLNLTYDNIRDVSIGRSGVLSKFYKIEKINQL